MRKTRTAFFTYMILCMIGVAIILFQTNNQVLNENTIKIIYAASMLFATGSILIIMFILLTDKISEFMDF